MNRVLLSLIMIIPSFLHTMEVDSPPNPSVMVKATDGNPLSVKQTVIEVSPVWKAMLARNQASKQSRSIDSQMSATELKVLIPFLELLSLNKEEELIAAINALDVQTTCWLYSTADYLGVESLANKALHPLPIKLIQNNELQNFIDDCSYIKVLLTLPEALQQQIALSLISQNTLLKNISANFITPPAIAKKAAPNLQSIDQGFPVSIVVNKTQSVNIRDAQVKACLNTLNESTDVITGILYHPVYSNIFITISDHYSTSYDGANASTIKIWNTQTRNCISLHGHVSWISEISLSNNNILTSITADGTVRIWELQPLFNFFNYTHTLPQALLLYVLNPQTKMILKDKIHLQDIFNTFPSRYRKSIIEYQNNLNNDLARLRNENPGFISILDFLSNVGTLTAGFATCFLLPNYNIVSYWFEQKGQIDFWKEKQCI